MSIAARTVSLPAQYGNSVIGLIAHILSSSMIFNGGSLSKSESSSTGITSTGGLPDSESEEDGVFIVDKASLSDSTLILGSAASPSPTMVEGEGEGGEERIVSRCRAVRRLMVTLLEVGSGGNSEEGCGGVEGGSALSISLPSLDIVGSAGESCSAVVSTDILRDLPFAFLCRFLEVFSSSSVNGFVRAEQGSEGSSSAVS